jgi:hypothetical protein
MSSNREWHQKMLAKALTKDTPTHVEGALRRLGEVVVEQEDRIAELETQLGKAQSDTRHYRATVLAMSRGVGRLWKSVQDGMHNARSLVGDCTLDMADQLKVHNLGPLATNRADGPSAEHNERR